MAILDIEGNPIGSLSLHLESAEVATAQIQIRCIAGKFLRCDPVDDALIEAKLSTDTLYVNIETTPIDLTPFDTLNKIFDLRFTASSVLLRVFHDFKVYAR